MIKINRATGYVDKTRSYKVMVDEHQIGVINDGETKSFILPDGEHTIYLKIDWCRSNKLKFAIKEGEKLEFDCGNALKGWKILFDMLYVTILKNHYLWIKTKKEEEKVDALEILNELDSKDQALENN